MIGDITKTAQTSVVYLRSFTISVIVSYKSVYQNSQSRLYGADKIYKRRAYPAQNTYFVFIILPVGIFNGPKIHLVRNMSASYHDATEPL
jgi:hypothetical protein